MTLSIHLSLESHFKAETPREPFTTFLGNLILEGSEKSIRELKRGISYLEHRPASEKLDKLWDIALKANNTEALRTLEESPNHHNLGLEVHTKLLAHRFNLSSTFELGDLNFLTAFYALFSSAQLYLDSSKKDRLLSYIETILEVEREENLDKKTELLIKNYQQGKPIFIRLNGGGQMAGVLLQGKRLIKLSKELPSPGLHIYTLNALASQVTVEFLKKLFNQNQKDLNLDLYFNFESRFETKPHRGKLSAWTLSKLALRGLLILEEGTDKQEVFKRWSALDRVSYAKNYLKQKTLNPNVMTALLHKTKNSELKGILKNRLTHTKEEEEALLALVGEIELAST